MPPSRVIRAFVDLSPALVPNIERSGSSTWDVLFVLPRPRNRRHEGGCLSLSQLVVYRVSSCTSEERASGSGGTDMSSRPPNCTYYRGSVLPLGIWMEIRPCSARPSRLRKAAILISGTAPRPGHESAGGSTGPSATDTSATASPAIAVESVSGHSQREHPCGTQQFGAYQPSKKKREGGPLVLVPPPNGGFPRSRVGSQGLEPVRPSCE